MIQTYCYYLAICVIDERVRGKEKKIKFMARVALCSETAFPVPRTFALQVPSLRYQHARAHRNTVLSIVLYLHIPFPPENLLRMGPSNQITFLLKKHLQT